MLIIQSQDNCVSEVNIILLRLARPCSASRRDVYTAYTSSEHSQRLSLWEHGTPDNIFRHNFLSAQGDQGVSVSYLNVCVAQLPTLSTSAYSYRVQLGF